MANYYFRKNFSRDFILEPNILLQINSELKSFVETEQLHLALEYQILKDDDEYYVTSDIEKLLSEPNNKRSRISRIVIRIGEEQTRYNNIKTPVFIECRFSRGDELLHGYCKVEIQDYRNGTSQQRLADELCTLFKHTQREASLNVIAIPNWIEGWLPPVLTFFLFLLWLRHYSPFGNIKLGDLSLIDFPFYLAATVIIYVLCFFLWKAVKLPRFLTKRFRTTGIFLWGAETHDFRRRVAFQEKLIWGFAIALIVGVLGSLIATWLTSNKS
jgi:hypothetical protein